MKNPIIDNRLIKDKTFATRLLSFAKDVRPSDPSTEEEKESMIYYATRLLSWQCVTAVDTEEIDYLERTNGYENSQQKPIFITEDKYRIFEKEDIKVTLVSCPRKLTLDTFPVYNFIKGKSDLELTSVDRVYFIDIENCKKYILENVPSISLKDLAELGLLDQFNLKTKQDAK